MEELTVTIKREDADFSDEDISLLKILAKRRVGYHYSCVDYGNKCEFCAKLTGSKGGCPESVFGSQVIRQACKALVKESDGGK